jgi:hypothetical protein
MWNSNSLVSWLLARSGHNTARIDVPWQGRAPGWSVGLTVASRENTRSFPSVLVEHRLRPPTVGYLKGRVT